MHNALLDSSRWARLTLRDDDIVIASWPKSGTTWMQQVVAQLLFRGDPGVFGQAISPWIECRFLRDVHLAVAQQHRRILKTHLPAYALPLDPSVRHFFVARDPRDMFLSWHRHQELMSDAVYELMNRTPGRQGPQVRRLHPDFATAFDAWLDNDDAFVGPFWPNLQSWWDLRDESNVTLVHYSEMVADLEALVLRVAADIGVGIEPAKLPAIVRHCGLEHMRILASRDRTLGWTFRHGGGGFINKGDGGRWRSSLSADVLDKLERKASACLSVDCARWLFSPLPALPARTALPGAASAGLTMDGGRE